MANHKFRWGSVVSWCLDKSKFLLIFTYWFQKTNTKQDETLDNFIVKINPVKSHWLSHRLIPLRQRHQEICVIMQYYWLIFFIKCCFALCLRAIVHFSMKNTRIWFDWTYTMWTECNVQIWKRYSRVYKTCHVRLVCDLYDICIREAPQTLVITVTYTQVHPSECQTHPLRPLSRTSCQLSGGSVEQLQSLQSDPYHPGPGRCPDLQAGCFPEQSGHRGGAPASGELPGGVWLQRRSRGATSRGHSVLRLQTGVHRLSAPQLWSLLQVQTRLCGQDDWTLSVTGF